MHMLWTMPYLPWPITSGGKARQYNLLRQLAGRGYHITLLVQSKAALDAASHAALSPHVEQLIVLPRRRLLHPLTLWRAAVSPLPLLTTVNGHAPELSRRFDDLLQSRSWDVVQIEHSYGLQPFEAALARRRQPFVLCEHNVESELGAATYGKWPAPLRPLARYDRWRARRWEQRALGQASIVIAVTDPDAQALRRISGGRPTEVVGNGVDTGVFARVSPDPASCRVLFVGNYEYAPNVDALEWALSDILPRLWQSVPQARFLVCGHALSPAWRQRFTDPRIEWRGYVEDLPAAQSEASVFLAPLRFGGGSKLKVLEALAAGLPVVSTREGLSGLDARDGEHALVADTAHAIALALKTVLTDAQRARALGEGGRALVRRRFDWSASADQLQAVHEALAGRGSVPMAAMAAEGAA